MTLSDPARTASWRSDRAVLPAVGRPPTHTSLTIAGRRSRSGGLVLSFETESTLARAIEEHLELKRRNAVLELERPLDRYQVHDPFENHPLFKTEEQARLED